MCRFSQFLKMSSLSWGSWNVYLHKLNRPWSARAQNNYEFSLLIVIFCGSEFWKFVCAIFPSWCFSLFSSHFCLIMYWNCKGKIIWQMVSKFYGQIMLWSSLTDNWQIIPNFNWENHVLISISLLTTDRWFQISTDKIIFSISTSFTQYW